MQFMRRGRAAHGRRYAQGSRRSCAEAVGAGLGHGGSYSSVARTLSSPNAPPTAQRRHYALRALNRCTRLPDIPSYVLATHAVDDHGSYSGPGMITTIAPNLGGS